jgi:hypothetical protein
MEDVMEANLEHEEGRLHALRQRCADLKKLASTLFSDGRWLSTSLDAHDPLVLEAKACRAQIGTPLTIGTLLAAVLAELQCVEDAIRALERQLYPQVLLSKQGRRFDSGQHVAS